MRFFKTSRGEDIPEERIREILDMQLNRVGYYPSKQLWGFQLEQDENVTTGDLGIFCEFLKGNGLGAEYFVETERQYFDEMQTFFFKDRRALSAKIQEKLITAYSPSGPAQNP